MVRAFVGVGSNIEPARNVRGAILGLAHRTRLAAISTVYLTEALGRPEQAPYFNCVVEVHTEVTPWKMKRAILRQIEDSLGRVRLLDKYAPRTIDLDLIVYGDLIVEGPEIWLPDPDILERPFLGIPLFELAPDLVLPGFNLQIREVAARLSRLGMTPLEAYTERLRKEAGCVGFRERHTEFPYRDVRVSKDT